MNFTERANAVRNALQFLGPLQDLAKSLGEAADAERFLKDAGPQITALREEIASVEAELVTTSKALDAEKKMLQSLYDDGVADVKRRVASVEKQMSDDAAAAGVKLERMLAGIRADIKTANSELLQAEANRDLVQTEVRRLMGEKADLEADLATIAARAGGKA